MVREFCFRSRSVMSLAAVLLVAACSDVPTATAPRTLPVVPAGDLITADAAAAAGAIFVSPDQDVVIEGEETITARFHSNLHVQPNGDGSGSARLVYDTCRTFPITGTVTPEPAEDCLIYDILGPDVHDGVELEAEGRLVFPEYLASATPTIGS